jgi:peptidoglycan/xylan/chitin deacetylase (PgdA/CDA1 family)
MNESAYLKVGFKVYCYNRTKNWGKKMRQFVLTFDTEDFISQNSFTGLLDLLKRLKKHNHRGLFFITGHMAEKLAEHPEVLEFLKDHEIGYHSSSHSVHPTIFEFTDMESYSEAHKISMLRETSHINPLTGVPEGAGGIYAVRKLFPSKEVASFRAPGFCWSPPHLEALRDLGVKYDFSTNISKEPFSHKGITFYPYPHIGDWRSTFADYRIFWLSAIRDKFNVACLHPSLLVNQTEWDSIFWKENPSQITYVPARSESDIKSIQKNIDSLLSHLSFLEKTTIASTNPLLKKSDKTLTFTKEDAARFYEFCVRWPHRYFDYEPKYLRSHFERFFCE